MVQVDTEGPDKVKKKAENRYNPNREREICEIENEEGEAR